MKKIYKRRRKEREEIEQGIAFSNFGKIYLSDSVRFFGVRKLKKWTKWNRRKNIS